MMIIEGSTVMNALKEKRLLENPREQQEPERSARETSEPSEPSEREKPRETSVVVLQ